MFIEAKAIYDHLFDSQQNKYFARIYNDLGTVNQSNADFDAAINNYIRSLQIYRKLYGILQPKVAEGYYNVASLYFDRKEYEKGLFNIQECFISNVPGFTEEDYMQNPSIQNSISEFLLLQSMFLKAELWYGWALESKGDDRKKALQEALNSYTLSSKIVDRLRRGYVSEESKLFLTQKTAVIYEKGILITRILTNSENKVDMDNIAFEFSENSKVGVLIGTIQEANAKRIAGIPDSLLNYERDIQIKMVKLEKNIINELKKAPRTDSVLLKGYQTELFNLKTNYSNYIHELEKKIS